MTIHDMISAVYMEVRLSDHHMINSCLTCQVRLSDHHDMISAVYMDG